MFPIFTWRTAYVEAAAVLFRKPFNWKMLPTSESIRGNSDLDLSNGSGLRNRMACEGQGRFHIHAHRLSENVRVTQQHPLEFPSLRSLALFSLGGVL